MNSKDLLKAGKLTEARQQLVLDVKSAPADAGVRTLLFQTLIFCGEWEKAQNHIEVIAAQDPEKATAVHSYKELLQAEKERAEVSQLKGRPSFLPEAPNYIEIFYSAWEKLAEGKIEEAKDLFEQIHSRQYTLSGTVNNTDFTGFSDTDSVLSLFLETFVHERYVWIPFESIRELTISPPKTFFDLIWASAAVTTWAGLCMNCYLPVLYPGSHLQEDDRIKLGRLTVWTSLGGPFSKGLGQHVFQIGQEEMSILEIEEAVFNPPAIVKDPPEAPQE